MRRVAKRPCLCVGGSRRPDSALAAASEELLRSLQAGSVAPSDVLSLHRMKTLLLLQDPGPLQLSLDEFARRCAMPPGAYAREPDRTGHTGPRGGGGGRFLGLAVKTSRETHALPNGQTREPSPR